MTDTMQMQAAVSIDRKIGGTNAPMPVVEQTPTEVPNTPVNAPYEPTEPHPEPEPRKINVYAETKEQCEIKLAEMIARVKAEIAEEKAKLKEGSD